MKFPEDYPRLIIFLLISTLLLPSCQASTPESERTATLESTPTEAVDPTLKDRELMVMKQIEGRGVENPDVLAAMLAVPRHKFVPDNYIPQAYADHPLPIGHGQTISQPFIVALMTEALALEEGDRVLEIGTGSGYQAAVLAELGTIVYTVEIIPELALDAEERLRNLGYTNIEVLNADGYFGWEEHAPFDGVIVTAAPDHLPQPLIEQLDEGARMIIPIGPVGAVQTLWLFKKVEGELMALNLGPVSFVPLTGEH